MKSIQKPELIKGTKVLFFTSGMPHTGIIEEYYTNICTVVNITFLDSKFDSLMPWSVTTNQIYKTDQFQLPLYPTLSQITYVSSIINQCYTNKDCDDLDYSKFEKLFPKKTVLSNLINPWIDISNYITLNDHMIIKFNNVTDVLYLAFDLAIDDDTTYVVLEEFTEYEQFITGIPNRIIIPKWLDKKRVTVDVTDDDILSTIKSNIQKTYNLSDEDTDTMIHLSVGTSEFSIKEIWTPNTLLFENKVSFIESDGKSVFIIRNKLTDGIDINTRSFDRIY